MFTTNNMNTYRITYQIGDKYQGWVVEAETEVEAIVRILDSISKEASLLLHGFAIEKE